MRRIVRRIAIGVLGFVALYLVAGNVFLNSTLGPWAINRKPDRFRIDWSHGVTWWPGFVALWNVETIGQVRRVTWEARAAHAHGRIALLPLFSRELRFATIEADEVDGSIGRSDEDLAPPPARAGGWTLRFDRIATDSLRHARIDGADLATRGEAAVGFIKQLRGGPFELLPSHAMLRDAVVTLGERTLMRSGTIALDFAIARHRHEDAPGLARLGLADANLRIEAELPGLTVDLDPAGHWRGAISGAAGSGRVQADLSIVKGLLQAGGHVALELPLGARRGTTTTIETARLRVDVDGSGLHLVARLPPPPEGEGSIDADLRIAGTSLHDYIDARALLPRVSGRLDLDWQFESLAWAGPLLVKAPWLALDGRGRVDAELALRDGLLQPGSRVEVPDVLLAATIAGHRFRGQARASGRLVDEAGGPKASVDLLVARYDVADVDAPDKVLMRGSDLRIGLAAAGELRDFRESARASVRFERAEVPDLHAINAYLPGDSLSVLGGAIRLRGDLALDADGRISDGQVGVQARRARARLGEIELAGDFDLDARVGGSDPAARRFDLDASTLDLRNVTVVDAGRTAGERWWAKLVLARGRIEATRPLRIDADAAIEMQDVGLLLALFTRHRDYPRWVLRLVDAGPVQANGRMRMDGSALVFDRVEAANARFDIKARMQLGKAHPRGDLLLQWRALAIGLQLDRAGREFHLLRAKEWYAARPPLIDAR